MSTDVVLLADAAPGAGLGHLARCSALGVALEELGLRVAAVALDAAGPLTCAGLAWQAGAPPQGAVRVLDSYRHGDVDAAVVFEDLGRQRPEAQLVVCPAEENTGDPRRLTGFAHACLHPCLWEPPDPPAGAVSRVLVSVGGTGTQDEAARLCAAGFAAGAAVAVVRGPHAAWEPPPGVELVDAPGDLCAEWPRCDLVVTAAGQTMVEAAAAGRPTVAVVLSADQAPQAATLAAAGAVLVPEDPAAEVARLAGDDAARRSLATMARAVVDGGGARRVARAIAALCR